MATTAPIVSLATTNVITSIQSHATDAAYVAAKGTAAANGDIYYNTTESAVRVYQGAWQFVKAGHLLAYASTSAYETAKVTAVAEGDLFFDTTDDVYKQYVNAAWRPLTFISASKTTTYTATEADDLIYASASGGNFTITIPAASASWKWKRLVVTKTDTSANIVTLGTGLSTTLDTEGETVLIECNGSAWTLLWRTIPSKWNSFSPTLAWTANTNSAGFWKRTGDSMTVRIAITLTGAPTSATLTATVPLGATIDTAKLPDGTGIRAILGHALVSDAAGGAGTGLIPAWVYYATTTTVKLASVPVAAATDHYLTEITEAVPVTFANGDKITLEFTVPISGWKG